MNPASRVSFRIVSFFRTCEYPTSLPVATCIGHMEEPTPVLAEVEAEATTTVEAVVEPIASAAPAAMTSPPPLHTLAMISDQTAVVTAEVDDPVKKRRRGQGTSVPRWTPDEETRLKELVVEIGERDWAKVAERLGSGRSAAGVDQHWCICPHTGLLYSTAVASRPRPPAWQANYERQAQTKWQGEQGIKQ